MSEANVYGTICHFETPQEIYEASKKVREAGYTRFETFTPFPVHGLDKAMGLKPTPLPWIILGGGITGFCAGLGLQMFANGSFNGEPLKFGTDLFWLVGYPFTVSGKPSFDIIPSIPIIFELTVLLSAFGAVFGMLALNGLPKWYHAVFRHKSFRRATDDGFFLVIEARDSKYVTDQVSEFLSGLGGLDVEELPL